MSQIPTHIIRNLAERHAVIDAAASPAVSVEDTARRLGLVIEETTFSDPTVSGRLVRRGERVVIEVRLSDPDRRRRFTIAHEIGHHLLHPGDDWSDTDAEVTLYERGMPVDRPGRQVEGEANRFAAELLMPESEVRRIWRLTASLPVTAAAFQVSEAAMTRRLEEFDLAARSPDGFLFLDVPPLAGDGPGMGAPPLRDADGEIPRFGPLRTDAEGRIIPPAPAELDARYSAADRVLALPPTPGLSDISPEVFRAIDALRPERPLFGEGAAP